MKRRRLSSLLVVGFWGKRGKEGGAIYDQIISLLNGWIHVFKIVNQNFPKQFSSSFHHSIQSSKYLFWWVQEEHFFDCLFLYVLLYKHNKLFFYCSSFPFPIIWNSFFHTLEIYLVDDSAMSILHINFKLPLLQQLFSNSYFTELL